MSWDLTGLGSLFDFGSKVVDKLFPDPQKAQEAKIELFKLQQSGELAVLAASTNIAEAQIGVNLEQAKSEDKFASRPRPFAMWIGGIGLAYASIVEPLLRFVAMVGFGYVGDFPVLDTTVSMQILFGLLGLGMMRSYDKKQGTS